MNLLDYLPNDHQSWIADIAAKMGWDDLTKYYNQVFLMLLQMKPNTFFSVVDKVRPENYELFMKCSFSAIQELTSMKAGTYTYEKQGTIIIKR